MARAPTIQPSPPDGDRAAHRHSQAQPCIGFCRGDARSSELLDADKARVLEVPSDGCSESATLVRDLKLEDQEARGELGPLPREILRGLRVFVLVGRAQGEATG